MPAAWMRGDLTYNGRKLKGLSNVDARPGARRERKAAQDATPSATPKRMPLASGDTRNGTRLFVLRGKHRIARYPFTANRFGPPTGAVPLPAGAKAYARQPAASRR